MMAERVTSVEVIDLAADNDARAYTNHSVDDAWVDMQDDGRTIKVFINTGGWTKKED